MRRIGLIGYFGAGAYSDDLIEDVTKRLLLEQRSDLVFDSSILGRGPAASDPAYLNGFDLLVHCGGSLLGKCTHYPVRDIAQWADKVHTPLCVFGIGYRYEADKEPLAPEMRRRIEVLFDKAEIITVRGYKTVQHLKENGIGTAKISGYADPVTAWPRGPTTQGPLMGNVRLMPDVEVQHAPTESVHRLMAQAYDWLIDLHKQPLTLVSWRHNLDYDNDLEGAKRVVALMRHADRVQVVAPQSHLEAISLISGASFYFGQRLHPSVYAATQGVPFVGLEYQFDKMLDWASTVGADNVIHTGSAGLGDFIEAYTRVEANMARLARTVPQKAAEIRDAARRIAALL